MSSIEVYGLRANKRMVYFSIFNTNKYMCESSGVRSKISISNTLIHELKLIERSTTE